MNEDTQTTGAVAPSTEDTATTQPSEASVQEAEAPEATQATEGMPEVNATDTAEEKLLAGKYKTVEDLEKSYKELESKYGQTTSEKAELSRILNESFIAPEPSDTAEFTQDEADPVSQEIDNLKRVTAVQSFVINHQDANPAEMNKILTSDPMMKQISGHEAKLEYAYLRSQNMATGKAIAEAEKKGAQAAQAKAAEKQVAQVEAADKAATKGDNASELLERATGNYTQADRDKARQELIRKQLINL